MIYAIYHDRYTEYNPTIPCNSIIKHVTLKLIIYCLFMWLQICSCTSDTKKHQFFNSQKHKMPDEWDNLDAKQVLDPLHRNLVRIFISSLIKKITVGRTYTILYVRHHVSLYVLVMIKFCHNFLLVGILFTIKLLYYCIN